MSELINKLVVPVSVVLALIGAVMVWIRVGDHKDLVEQSTKQNVLANQVQLRQQVSMQLSRDLIAYSQQTKDANAVNLLAAHVQQTRDENTLRLLMASGLVQQAPASQAQTAPQATRPQAAPQAARPQAAPSTPAPRSR